MNGHRIVSITMTIRIYKDKNIKYIIIPLGYKLYDKTCTKSELAKKLIHVVMPELTDFQVVALCETHIQKALLEILNDYNNIKIPGALRSDTVLYDLKPKPMGKRGRSRKKG